MDYFEQLGCEVQVVHNDIAPEELSFENIYGIVISPGPETPEKANNLNRLLPLFLGKLPILGICLGHQALAQYVGAKLKKAIKPMHGKVSPISISGGFVFEGLPSRIEVVRYHSLVIEDIPDILTPLAYTKEKELMAFQSLEMQLCGIQFHPEAALTQYGLQMLRNWLTFYNIV